jgi:3-hydroxyisobutyrate dehydrogenase-like beta-hydroxyacid dehydrogenase
MRNLRIGLIGLGNLRSQLAGNLLHHGAELTVRDLKGPGYEVDPRRPHA